MAICASTLGGAPERRNVKAGLDGQGEVLPSGAWDMSNARIALSIKGS